MAFATDMSAAARRHLEAGDSLAKGRKRRDVAGYLYGIAAECAIKAMMLELGMRPVADRRTADDPFFAHFPELRSMLRDALSRRRGNEQKMDRRQFFGQPPVSYRAPAS